MSRTLYLDVIGGAAGDMVLAALIDAGAPEEAVRQAVEAVLPARFRLATHDVRRAGVRARKLSVEQVEGDKPRLEPRPFRELAAALDRASLERAVKERAGRVLERLGAAEAAVHGIGLDAVQLHELGDDDTLLDVVGVAAALDALAIERVLVSSVPLARGGAAPGRHAHGAVPLPATVTLELLRGFPIHGAGSGETVTPTAAAIFAALGEPAPAFPEMTLEAVGYGAGTMDPADRPNVLRALVGTEPSPGAGDRAPQRDLLVLEANLDDLAPELVADAAEALLAAGALDVWTVPIQMKKGRPAVTLAALCEPEVAGSLTRAFFEATSTFGVRAHPVRRTELSRRVVRLDLPDGGGSVRVKVGFLGGRVVSAKPEHDDVAEVAARTGQPVRWVHEEAAAAARALRYQETEEPA